MGSGYERLHLVTKLGANTHEDAQIWSSFLVISLVAFHFRRFLASEVNKNH